MAAEQSSSLLHSSPASRRQSGSLRPSDGHSSDVYSPSAALRPSALPITTGLLGCALVMVVSSLVIFLLGVNIVIQVRTMSRKSLRGAALKCLNLLLSLCAMYGIYCLNLWTTRKLLASPSGTYSRLDNTGTDFELEQF
ncbi:AGL024W-Ap [Eremothecium gossypii ATCC 10895]|uniref:AGL024W-Ap n=1 Tax=Eremothecium gossypii (strain ATCC 10895 / CBS 109.51 / FGSC 9923 / NRRL Y-1056) TaxID=284811 RepID=D8FGG5_EREGS|nr:AGL024W-Ap [Eremothecium gossypii ATCC 10895]ADJ41742.1 AGL024W-Ap [Eremothecium gossypii ATCC 10895]AEY98798.1 FAGL024W-Ap [Eremothecium gossypii FDAG1]